MEIKKSDKFINAYEKFDKSLKIKIDKVLIKIIDNLEIGKPMRFSRKGTREVYINPFRLSYSYVKETNILNLLDIYHKDEQ